MESTVITEAPDAIFADFIEMDGVGTLSQYH